MNRYIKNLSLLKRNYIYSDSMEHDACGVGLIASTDGKKSRQVVEYGIQALKICIICFLKVFVVLLRQFMICFLKNGKQELMIGLLEQKSIGLILKQILQDGCFIRLIGVN